MSRVYILVEGQTEEAFLQELMVGPYAAKGLYLTPIIVTTSPGHRGGLTSYSKVKPQIAKLCKQDPGAYVTTLFDFYALPKDFPGQGGLPALGPVSAATKVAHLEQHLSADIGHGISYQTSCSMNSRRCFSPMWRHLRNGPTMMRFSILCVRSE